MNFDKPITRRESIGKLLKISGSLVLSGAATGSVCSAPAARAESQDKKFIVEGIGDRYRELEHGVPFSYPERIT